VAQHIFNPPIDFTNGAREIATNFTQEWPTFSQTHQFSYTIPYALPKLGCRCFRTPVRARPKRITTSARARSICHRRLLQWMGADGETGR
jgi:hypothetical protein